MIFLEGEKPGEPLVVMVYINPDGTTRNVSFLARLLSDPLSVVPTLQQATLALVRKAAAPDLPSESRVSA